MFPCVILAKMKKLILIIGIILSLLSFIRGGKYFLDYQDLSAYGKGYIWGNIILLVFSLLLIYWGVRKKKTSP